MSSMALRLKLFVISLEDVLKPVNPLLILLRTRRGVLV